MYQLITSPNNYKRKTIQLSNRKALQLNRFLDLRGIIV